MWVLPDDILDEEVKAGETTAPFSRFGRTLLKIWFILKKIEINADIFYQN